MSKLQWKSLRIGSEKNFCYLVFDSASREAALFDGAFELDKVVNFVEQEKVTVKFLVATHGHWDHAGGLRTLKASYPKASIAVGYEDRQLVKKLGQEPEVLLKSGSTLPLGEEEINVYHTPGHTEGGCCFKFGKNLITGDTLFIGQCGRTDLPGGSDDKLFQSLQFLKTFEDDVVVLPGHDYGPSPTDTIGNQKKTNPTMLVSSLDEFVDLS